MLKNLQNVLFIKKSERKAGAALKKAAPAVKY
jgi:hypothetical protein